MPSRIGVFAATFGIAAVLLPFVKRAGLRLGLIDQPGALKIHSTPTPRLGGVAIFAAMLIALSFTEGAAFRSAWPFFAALAMIWAAGLADDVYRASAALRLTVEVAAAAVLWYGGWRIPLPGIGAMGLALQCLCVVFVVNAFNFLDGSDGVAAGVGATIAAGYLVVPGGYLSSLGTACAWSLLGACIAFLVFNFPPATIFMGDAGSTAIGFCIAFLALDLYRAQPALHSTVIFPLVAGGLPFLDAVLAVLRRLRRGASPFHGDRRHFYDLLLARRWGARSVALACWGINAAFVTLGVLSVRSDAAWATWLSAVALAGFCVLVVCLGSLSSPEAGAEETRVKILGAAAGERSRRI